MKAKKPELHIPHLVGLAIGVSLAFGLLAACSSRVGSAPPIVAPPVPPTLRELYGMPKVTQLDPRKTALVLVDFQEEFFTGRLAITDAPETAKRAAALLEWARRNAIAVVHVRNVAKPGSTVFAPDSPKTAIVPVLLPRPDEVLLTKPGGGGFTKTALDETLRARGVDTVVVAGIQAHLAVALTAEDGAVLGYHVIVAADATTTRDLPNPVAAAGGGSGPSVIDRTTLLRATLAALADRFADVLTTDSIVALPLAAR